MSRKRTTFSTEFKTKIVLEVLKGERTINEIASQNTVTPKNIQNWKEKFLANAEMAMEPARAIKEYKEGGTPFLGELVVGVVGECWSIGM